MSKSLNEIISLGQDLLTKGGIEKSRYETMLIAQNVLQKPILDILTNSEILISNKGSKKIFKGIFKRFKRKPISKIIGKKEFFSNEFFVNSFVLDPRPESELMVEVVERLAQNEIKKNINVLELGVGSGCLIITILLRLKDKIINGLGVDISDEAIFVAKKNLEKFKLKHSLTLRKSDWFSNVKGIFDLIISNPPYLKSSEIRFLDPEVKFYDPNISLDGGCDGLYCYKDIAKNAKKHVNKNSKICLEIGSGQSNSVKKIFDRYGFQLILEEKDLQGINRVVVYKLK